MNKTTCGFISQHSWEFPQLNHKNSAAGQSIKDQFKDYFLSLIEEQNVSRFLVSIELGYPLDAATAILELRNQYPISLECVIPYEEQHITWSEEDRNQYFFIMEQCDQENLLQHLFTLDCYQRSIKYLISQSNFLMVVWSGISSDAGDAIQYSRQKGQPVYIIDPNQLCADS